MRKIKINSWKSKVPIYEDGKVVGSEEKDETLLDALNILIANKKPENIPRGIDKFRLYGRLAKAFDKADETKVLELEESDYSFLKKTIEEDAPATWGMNLSINEAIEGFLEVKEDSK